VQHLPEQGEFLDRIAQIARQLRFLEEGKQLPDLTQGGDRLLPHRERDAARGAEQIAEQGDVRALRVLEQQRRPGTAQRALTDFGDFKPGVHRRADPLEFPEALQVAQKVAQALIFHLSHTLAHQPRA